MTNTRRSFADISYMGVNITTALAPYLKRFTFNDNEGASDEIQIELEDRERKWQGPWLPKKADKIDATIQLINWRKEGEVSHLDCGTFYVDDVNFQGPPDTITIKAVSVPFKDGGKETKHTRVWDNAGLKKIMNDLAKSAGLSLFYDAPDYFYDRVEQDKKTDLAFAKELAQKEGLSVKVTKNQLVVYDQHDYESKGPVRAIERGTTDVLKYDLKESAAEEQYKQVKISYWDGKKKKLIEYTYDVPGVKNGPVLKVNKRLTSLDEAKRFAQKEARNKNKSSKSGSITLMGDEKLLQGVTVDIKGFGAFDTKYFVESASHEITGGYTVKINIREVLSY